MRKIRDAKMLFVGLVIGVLLTGTTVLAAGAISSATFNDTAVIFDGATLDLDLPLISVVLEGQTNVSNYMPVRGVLTAMGFNVDWDGVNNAILVTSPLGYSPVDTATDNIRQIDEVLVGRWLWEGMLYYVFNNDGTGMMLDMEIGWTAANGVLYICITPDFCGDDCIAPMEWAYTLTDGGNRLNLKSEVLDMEYDYTRE